jgi:hypothetical protein
LIQLRHGRPKCRAPTNEHGAVLAAVKDAFGAASRLLRNP